MGIGQMNTFIDILSVTPVKDDEGFAAKEERVAASVRAYRETRHGSEAWKNRASFSSATALFRFRTIPGFEVTTGHVIVCAGGRYEIKSIEDIKNRGMYIEALCEKVESSG